MTCAVRVVIQTESTIIIMRSTPRPTKTFTGKGALITACMLLGGTIMAAAPNQSLNSVLTTLKLAELASEATQSAADAKKGRRVIYGGGTLPYNQLIPKLEELRRAALLLRLPALGGEVPLARTVRETVSLIERIEADKKVLAVARAFTFNYNKHIVSTGLGDLKDAISGEITSVKPTNMDRMYIEELLGSFDATIKAYDNALTNARKYHSMLVTLQGAQPEFRQP